MSSKTITSFPDEIEKYYQKLSLFINTDMLSINNECISVHLTIDMPRFYKMLLFEYHNNPRQQYVNYLMHDLYNLCKTYLVEVSKRNADCSFKSWVYFNVHLLVSGCDLSIDSLVYPFISHGILLHNINDYESILSPYSSAYNNFLVKRKTEKYEQIDLDYLSEFSIRFIGDIHRFNLLLYLVLRNSYGSTK